MSTKIPQNSCQISLRNITDELLQKRRENISKLLKSCLYVHSCVTVHGNLARLFSSFTIPCNISHPCMSTFQGCQQYLAESASNAAVWVAHGKMCVASIFWFTRCSKCQEVCVCLHMRSARPFLSPACQRPRNLIREPTQQLLLTCKNPWQPPSQDGTGRNSFTDQSGFVKQPQVRV